MNKIHNTEKWMVKMAIGSEFLQEGNTFAKSVWLHLVEKVAQSLSSIITTPKHLRSVPEKTDKSTRRAILISLIMLSAINCSFKSFLKGTRSWGELLVCTRYIYCDFFYNRV